MLKGLRSLIGIDKSVFLLLAIFAFVFVFPAIDTQFVHNIASTIAYALVLLSIFSILQKRNRWIRYVIVFAIATVFLLLFTDNKNISAIVFTISACTFSIAAILMINDIAVSKVVDSGVVIQSISGYLLLGIIGVLINTIILAYNPDAISISETNDKFSAIIYYSFITLTTIGYGEIVPNSPAARSVSILIGAAGQIYLTVIIAMIVGKYVSRTQ